ncbi:hypothetical protein K439DRAFT_1633402 [Ramaria rubella]|nr:hypothetical protein K439DRAFT_1633401 [Ramaria rubella]KAF8584586.1 hypothetical protein K439DRAFT_1633402 [Ramaria rubella]
MSYMSYRPNWPLELRSSTRESVKLINATRQRLKEGQDRPLLSKQLVKSAFKSKSC